MRAIQLEQYQDRADKTGCVALWRAVIYQALCDACYQLFESTKLEAHAKRPKYISRSDSLIAHQARQFLLADRTRFPIVCNLALIDPAFLRRRARRATSEVDLRLKLVRPSQPRSIMKFYLDRINDRLRPKQGEL